LQEYFTRLQKGEPAPANTSLQWIVYALKYYNEHVGQWNVGLPLLNLTSKNSQGRTIAQMVHVYFHDTLRKRMNDAVKSQKNVAPVDPKKTLVQVLGYVKTGPNLSRSGKPIILDM
jgi:hypothetical protein